MEVEAPPAIVQHFVQQLDTQSRSANAFARVFRDYQEVSDQLRRFQVRCAQLDKEAGELRHENEALRESALLQRNDTILKAQVAVAEEKAKAVQEELNVVLRDKARLAEDNLNAHRMLEVVRQTNKQQILELTEAAAKERELKAKVKSLNEQLDEVRKSHTLATSEVQSHIQARDKAEAQAVALQGDLKEVTQRLIEEKDQHLAKIERTNAMCEEMISHARQAERESLTKAAAAEKAAEEATQRTRQWRSGPAGLLDRMSSLSGRATQGITAASRQSSEGQSQAADSLAPLPPIELPGHAMNPVNAHAGCGYTLAFDRPGARVASGGDDKIIRIWDPADGRPIGSLEGMIETVTEVAFTSDSNTLLAAGTDKAVRVFNLETSRVRHTLTGHSGKVFSVACSPADARAAASSGQERFVRLWDLHRGISSQSKGFTSTVYSLKYNLEGSMVICGHHNGTLRFWDFRDNKLANEVAGLHTQQICSVAVGGRTGVVLTCGKDNCVRLVDARTFQVRKTLSAPGFMVATTSCTACLSPDETHAAAGSSNGAVFIWEIESGKAVRTLRDAGTQNVHVTAWSPLGRPLISLDKSGVMTRWQS
ncbi:hypothetical protein WJX73_001530 [Symbiochloris irregularis]|uniref:Autophagy-related protein 16 domain-containing protein n=1 Tax=Symbiochloris irregularis TaxID=706552 RepID=A0AAW1NN32_9CHLO